MLHAGHNQTFIFRENRLYYFILFRPQMEPWFSVEVSEFSFSNDSIIAFYQQCLIVYTSGGMAAVQT